MDYQNIPTKSALTDDTDTVDGDELFALPRYRPKELNKLCHGSKFEKKEIRLLYQGFKQECPNGICNEDAFKNLFSRFFPLGDASKYAHFVFAACQRYTSKTSLDFESFLSLLCCISRGSLSDKMTWMFYLYDVNRSGYITRDGMLAIFEAVFKIIDVNAFVTYSVKCPVSAAEQVDRVFAEMDTNMDNKVTFQEFCDWCYKDPKRIENVCMFDTFF